MQKELLIVLLCRMRDGASATESTVVMTGWPAYGQLPSRVVSWPSRQVPRPALLMLTVSHRTVCHQDVRMVPLPSLFVSIAGRLHTNVLEPALIFH